MSDAFVRVISAYGREAVCRDKEGTEQGRGMAILRPMTKADWQQSGGVLGSYSSDRFLCLAVPTLPLECGGRILWDGGLYEVMTVRPIRIGGEITHLWSALRPAEEAAV